MSLLRELSAALERRSIPYALIGAAAMSTHGASRATNDLDLLLVGRSLLDSDLWNELRESRVTVEVRHGDRDDPLTGVVKLERAGEPEIDVVVGSTNWQARILSRAKRSEFAGATVPIACAADLVLLKLFAGAPQDRWDVLHLLDSDDTDSLKAQVTSEVVELPADARQIWQSILEERESRTT